MILERGLLFQHLVCYSHPKMPEIRGDNILNCDRSAGPFPQVAGFDIFSSLFSSISNLSLG